MKKFRFPTGNSQDPIERQLGDLMHSYIQPKAHSYDLYFLKLLRKRFNYMGMVEKRIETQDQINSFVDKYGYLPNQSSLNPEESKLANHYFNYLNPKGRSYDKDFIEKHKNTLTFKQYKLAEKAKKVIEFYNTNGVPPSSESKDSEEEMLAHFVYSLRYRVTKLRKGNNKFKKRSGFINQDLLNTILSMKKGNSERTKRLKKARNQK